MYIGGINSGPGWIWRSIIGIVAWVVAPIEAWYWRRQAVRQRWRRMKEWKRFHPF